MGLLIFNLHRNHIVSDCIIQYEYNIAIKSNTDYIEEETTLNLNYISINLLRHKQNWTPFLCLGRLKLPLNKLFLK